MLAARLDEGQLNIRDVPVPEPGDGEALVRISAAGVCHSDLHLARGDWIGVPRTGSLGHEAIGVVESVGRGAEQFVAVGDRVILGLGGAGGAYWCGACRYCLSGQEAPLACGGLTAYGAVKKLVNHHVMPGRPIAVIGAAGGLGHYAVQIATAFGYEVVGVDVGSERLDFVKSLGAVMALDASDALDV